MRQPVQFARRLPTMPASSPAPPEPRVQMEFTRPISRRGTFGFACLSVSLAAVTFVATTWNGQLPADLKLSEILRFQSTAAASTEIAVPETSRVPQPSSQPEVVFEPKTTGRLPVFGGMIPTER